MGSRRLFSPWQSFLGLSAGFGLTFVLFGLGRASGAGT